jgi:hypothetical protein
LVPSFFFPFFPCIHLLLLSPLLIFGPYTQFPKFEALYE